MKLQTIWKHSNFEIVYFIFVLFFPETMDDFKENGNRRGRGEGYLKKPMGILRQGKFEGSSA